jgi:hypothetical protein
MGGLDKFKSLKTAVIKGKMNVDDMDFSMSVYLIANRAVRVELEVMGSKIIQSYKDGKGWMMNPLEGSADPRDLTDEETMDLKDELFLTDDLMDYKDQGHKLGSMEAADIAGTPCWKIQLMKKSGKQAYYYVDKKNFLLVKSESDSKEGRSENYCTDYKTINGMKFAFSMKEMIDGELSQHILIESMEVDLPVDEKIFDKPVK